MRKTIAVLGPAGTFSERAAGTYFGTTAEKSMQFMPSFHDVVEAVKNTADYGVVPLENMLDGSVGEALDELYRSPLAIIAEIIIPVHHCFAILPSEKIEDIRTAVSLSKALGQCAAFIQKHHLMKREALSTAAAAQEIAEKRLKGAGAICTETAAKRYGLKIVAARIEDNHDNVTRFAVIAKHSGNILGKKGKYKTSIVVCPKADRPGVLYELLKSFAKQKINLTKIESRPTKLKLGEYVFYIDLQGHAAEKNVKNALREIRKSADVKILGSYPQNSI